MIRESTNLDGFRRNVHGRTTVAVSTVRQVRMNTNHSFHLQRSDKRQEAREINTRARLKMCRKSR